MNGREFAGTGEVFRFTLKQYLKAKSTLVSIDQISSLSIFMFFVFVFWSLCYFFPIYVLSRLSYFS